MPSLKAALALVHYSNRCLYGPQTRTLLLSGVSMPKIRVSIAPTESTTRLENIYSINTLPGGSGQAKCVNHARWSLICLTTQLDRD